jgi:hypothetical protein
MTASVVSRDPGQTIKALLRAEVNFGCPVRFPDGSGCGCPILTYHHFDPPWARGHGHDPQGMIALCPEHHHQADGGLWTDSQLRQMKLSPFVDSQLRVRWPWQTERMLIKVGPCPVLEGGCALRLDGIPVARFAPAQIPAFGSKVALLDSNVRDHSGEQLLSIRDGWLDLDASRTSDALFTAQTKTFSVRSTHGALLSLRFRRPTAEAFKKWLPTFWSHREGHAGIFDTLESHGAIDSDGRVPYTEFEGHFMTPSAQVDVVKHRLLLRVPSLENAGNAELDSHLVDYDRRMVLQFGDTKKEFFSIG